MKRYRVVYSFRRTKADAKKDLAIVKKKWATAEIQEDPDIFAVILTETDSYNEALDITIKGNNLGLHCGVQDTTKYR